jgi:uncharacterized membrane protein (UPF0127 family)
MLKDLFSAKKICVSVSLGCLLVLAGIGVWLFAREQEGQRFPQAVVIGEKQYALEGADTDVKKEKGLGGRESLCETCGMLFLFDTPGVYKFWMKDMLIPIDIVWLSGETVVFIAENVQPDFMGIIDPVVRADRVFEVNAFETQAVKVGDSLEFLY